MENRSDPKSEVAQQPQYIRWFEEISLDDIALVGGKTASLGEMYQELKPLGIEIPNGFAVTADAYRVVVENTESWQEIHRLLDGLTADETKRLAAAAEQVRNIIYKAELPINLVEEIKSAYVALSRQYDDNLSVAVRSSATAEDLPQASFAGQHDSFLNVSGTPALIDACRKCFASLFTERAVLYRLHNGFDHFQVRLSIAVMKMVRADLASSGVMFTLDTDSGFRDVVLINGAYGLGENIVQGAVDPDEFYVHKPSFQRGSRCVLRHQLGEKQFTMVYSDKRVAKSDFPNSAKDKAEDPVRNIATPKERQKQYCLTDQEVLRLAEYAIKTECHYAEKKGAPSPMDIEWAKDGEDGKLYLIQARPETIASQTPTNTLERYVLSKEAKSKPKLLASGRAIGARIATGRVRLIEDVSQLADFQAGDIILADSTSPDWGPAMRRAAGLITRRGGRTCHAAIVAREFGIPAVVGIGKSDEKHGSALQDGQLVTLSCAIGDVGAVLEGEIPFDVITTALDSIEKPRTRLMINLGSPEQAFRLSSLPCDGVGLARMEFIINQHIRVHPMALLYPDRVSDPNQRQKIASLVAYYPSGAEYFVEKLSEGIGTIAAAFYPRPVVVRLSDFKTNEYAGLLGGADFEPKEENPMLGFRGASRYTHEKYAEGFALECAAIKRVRDEMGLHNLELMVPFCRRVEEAQRVRDALATHGLTPGGNGLKLLMMCEIPNNVIQIDAFSQLFDGISIGSNDLTQLILGVDRDSDIVAFDFDERDPGVMEMLRMAIAGAHRNGIPAGICGQAPSDYPEVAEYLVKLGIDSISLSPDVLLNTIKQVAQIEARILEHKSLRSQSS
jgi:pyruvate, water dikinase